MTGKIREEFDTWLLKERIIEAAREWFAEKERDNAGYYIHEAKLANAVEAYEKEKRL